MWTFLIILAVLAAGYTVYKLRVPIMAKVLGQSESRIDRHLK